MFKRLKYTLFKENPLRTIITNEEYARVKSYRRFQEGETKILGRSFRFSDNEGFLHSLEEIFKEQVYKFNSAQPTPFIIDAGANIGLSVAYFKQLYPAARIVAFEPDPGIFAILQKNAATLAYTNLDLRNAAVWVADTTLEFFAEGSLAGSTEINFKKQAEKHLVKAERLKKWLEHDRVDFLKIDVEGAENTVFFDLQSALPNVENLFLEYHSLAGKEQMLGEMLNVIKQAGFKYYVKSAADFNLFPFTTGPKTGFDLQLNIFCFRHSI